MSNRPALVAGSLDLPVVLRDDPELERLASRARDLAELGISDNTRRAYLASWRGFSKWCSGRAFAALPARVETVALYLAWISGRSKISTIRRHLAAISTIHRAAGESNPTKAPQIGAVLRGIARTNGQVIRQAAPLTMPELRSVLDAIPDDLAGVRDRAIVLIGISAGFRRSEIVGLDFTDLRFTDRGLEISVRSSKTDQEGIGATIPVVEGTRLETCPILAIRAWISEAGSDAGPVFTGIDRWGNLSDVRLTGRAISLILQRSAARVGIDTSRISGHTLRASFATLAAEHGATERDIARVGRWSSVATLRRYIRQATLFDDHPMRGTL